MQTTLDLPAQIPHLLSALRTFPQWRPGPRCTRRYEHVWLPLLAAAPPALAPHLLPPPDVHRIHVLHMLRPQAYRRDLPRILPPHAPLANLLDRPLLPASDAPAARERARALWEARFPREPFYPPPAGAAHHVPARRDADAGMGADADMDAKPRTSPPAPPSTGRVDTDADTDTDTDTNPHTSPPAPPSSSALSFDVDAAAREQLALYYHLAVPPQYASRPFLEDAARQYLHRFLPLKKRHPHRVLVPSRAISAAWLTHILHPHHYHRDTVAFFGHPLPYDGALDGALDGPDLLLALRETRRLWAALWPDRGPARYGELWRGRLTLEEARLQPMLRKVVASYVHAWRHIPGARLHTAPACAPAPKSPAPAVQWVHAQSLRNCQTASGGMLNRVSGVTERFVDLVVQARGTGGTGGKAVHMLCARVVHGLGMTEKPGVVVLAQLGYVEVFSGAAREVSGDDAPLASAERLHGALPRGSEPWEEQDGETCVMLRVGGEDAGIVKFRAAAPEQGRGGLRPRLPWRKAAAVRRRYDMAVWRAQGGAEVVRLGAQKGWESEVSRFRGWGGVAVGKTGAGFGEWRVEVGGGEGVVMGFLVAMAECLVEAGDEQWAREWRRRNARDTTR